MKDLYICHSSIQMKERRKVSILACKNNKIDFSLLLDETKRCCLAIFLMNFKMELNRRKVVEVMLMFLGSKDHSTSDMRGISWINFILLPFRSHAQFTHIFLSFFLFFLVFIQQYILYVCIYWYFSQTFLVADCWS